MSQPQQVKSLKKVFSEHGLSKYTSKFISAGWTITKLKSINFKDHNAVNAICNDFELLILERRKFVKLITHLNQTTTIIKIYFVYHYEQRNSILRIAYLFKKMWYIFFQNVYIFE